MYPTRRERSWTRKPDSCERFATGQLANGMEKADGVITLQNDTFNDEGELELPATLEHTYQFANTMSCSLRHEISTRTFFDNIPFFV